MHSITVDLFHYKLLISLLLVLMLRLDSSGSNQSRHVAISFHSEEHVCFRPECMPLPSAEFFDMHGTREVMVSTIFEIQT